ncbi:GIY-YIG nuclease family protein [Aquabacterium sp.]|uniref:GIY-YIG nuclease family protein n=1 Tax=Aquabacterium sp. TaxID=1872578 RepID=UPI0024894B1A|nr:GIY-YIG nuclease family protein [Aquabacterium sp.]MDI1349438.1 GIY-YIG nuclease family protein [Aquabacterium sp.]
MTTLGGLHRKRHERMTLKISWKFHLHKKGCSMDLRTFLNACGHHVNCYGPDSRIKVFRHTSQNNALAQRLRYDQAFLKAYQEQQNQNIVNGVDFILSFVGDGPGRSLFKGAWDVSAQNITREQFKENNGSAADAILGVYPGETWFQSKFNADVMSEFIDRLVIGYDFGQQFAQWLNNRMEIDQIYSGGRSDAFPGFHDLMLTHAELSGISQPNSPRHDWCRKLSSVSGVYLITDTQRGKRYVGSAYGQAGIWGRWKEYIQNPGGGNVLLTEHVAEHGTQDLQYSILRVMPSNATPQETITAESIEKLKILTKPPHGLNPN